MMMRSLFLLAILATLVIIAVKKSDQTAWEAAKDLGETVQTTLADASPQTAASNLAENLPLNIGVQSTASPKPPSIMYSSRKPDGLNAGTVKTIKDHLKNSTQHEPLLKDYPAKTNPTPTKIATKQPEIDWPDMPALPVISVESRKITAPNPDQPMPVSAIAEPVKRPSPRADYADVKVYYENASRLLEEIK
jgi:hypothetical protein